MDGMVNTCELLINVVTSDKPKMLRGLGQNGTVAGTGACFSPVMDTARYRRIESTSPVTINLVERGKPVSLPSGWRTVGQGPGARGPGVGACRVPRRGPEPDLVAHAVARMMHRQL